MSNNTPTYIRAGDPTMLLEITVERMGQQLGNLEKRIKTEDDRLTRLFLKVDSLEQQVGKLQFQLENELEGGLEDKVTTVFERLMDDDDMMDEEDE